MYIERLDISFFRNLTHVTVELSPGINFFWGPNGAGKTAILEAAHVLARGRSFRSSRSRTWIQHGADALTVRGVLCNEAGMLETLAISKESAGKTVLRVNGEPEPRISEAAQRIPLQVLLPDVADLVFGSPQLRRQWLDWGAFHVKPEYLRTLRSYARALKQRNAGLKRVASGAESPAHLVTWTQQLVAEAEQVTDFRLAYLEELEPVFVATLAALGPEMDVRIGYRRGWNDEESLHKVLGDMGSRELKLGSTQAGPHRADIEIRVGSGSHAAKATSELSRGQGKSVASALKIAQARLLADREKRGSVFLIDDVGAELDEDHNARFFRLLEEMDCQILASSTQPPAGIVGHFTDKTTNVFHVERGHADRSPDG